jgi:hypothetical protein
MSSVAAIDSAPAAGATAEKLALTPIDATEPAVVKTGTIDLRVTGNKLQQQVDRARAIADAAGGYVSSSHVQTSSHHSASLVLRVPAAVFDRTITTLKGLGKVHSVTEGGQDISHQLVDLNARLINLKTQRQVLLGLMQKATTVAASIQVENELAQVQGQIEQLTGDLRYLNDRAAMSTITLSMMTTTPPAATPQHATALWQALARSANATVAVVTAMIVGAGYVLPIALIAGLIALLARRLWPSQGAQEVSRTPTP